MPKASLRQKRLVLPLTLQCRQCQTYIQRGKKFTAKREQVRGERTTNQRIKFALRPRDDASRYGLESVEPPTSPPVRLVGALDDDGGGPANCTTDALDTLETAIAAFIDETETLGSAGALETSSGDARAHESTAEQRHERVNRPATTLSTEADHHLSFLDPFLVAVEPIFDEEPLWLPKRRRN
ncbi:hypothetical protein F1559_001149 [Cyanidiococcus yangmingshanensis]|uniref:Uncharacterized protein n=1 Tax=Cyanidiococcus yangmingshanensis TaxID=2690220 RepID=A0A7J7IHR9_9RHOD|nr:hypothetical protein F1559_001149 [Cyanidiococcus yangmingshanensis]